MRVLDESDFNTGNVSIGTTVTVRFKGKKTTDTYQIVGSTEANPLGGKISDESPIGKALLGHVEGDKVEAETPGGVVVMTIQKISK